MTQTSNEHPALRTNVALVALAKGKACSVPLWVEEGYVTLHPQNEPQSYTAEEAKALWAKARQQAIGAHSCASTLPTGKKNCLALVYTLASGDNKDMQVPAMAHALNASTSRYSEAGKAIRAARDAARIAETGGWVHEPTGIIGPSKRKTASAAIRADHGNGWSKLANADALRVEYRGQTVQVSKASAPAPVVEAKTATVTKAELVKRCKQLSQPTTGTKADLQARINGVPLAGDLGWHS
tara:strand:+ start:140 stop:859 length:720 start_codon:yes stop_codon:yes gene_type:complete